MGCVHSKNESSDVHSNVYRVININESGVELCPGQIEITESDIILLREGRDSTLWPLHSLRRYGFEGEIFSFESGRRCETGEGIYAFKSRRASSIFRTLQQKIQLRNAIHDSVPYPVSRLTPSPQGRQTLQASVVHRSSVDNGQSEIRSNIGNNLSSIASSIHHPMSQVSRSPSTSDILEVTPLYPLQQQNGNQVTNVYQVNDFKKEHNNNQAVSCPADTQHAYSNDINRDLAILRNAMRQKALLSTMRDIEDENLLLEGQLIHENPENSKLDIATNSKLSHNSVQFAKLIVEQQDPSRLYVNVAPNENILDMGNSDTLSSLAKATKQVEYCNVPLGIKHEINTYANIMLGDIGDSTKSLEQLDYNSLCERIQKFSESDTFTSLSPVEEIEVNYAILDIDCITSSSRPVNDVIQPENNDLSSSSFGERQIANSAGNNNANAAIGYTTIDFERTIALSTVAPNIEPDVEPIKKKRKNSCSILFPSSFSFFDKGK